MTTRREPIEFIQDEDVVHSSLGAATGCLVFRLLKEGGHDETLEVAVREAGNIHHDRPSHWEFRDVQRVAASAVHTKDTARLVDRPPQAAKEAAKRGRVVLSAG